MRSWDYSRWFHKTPALLATAVVRKIKQNNSLGFVKHEAEREYRKPQYAPPSTMDYLCSYGHSSQKYYSNLKNIQIKMTTLIQGISKFCERTN